MDQINLLRSLIVYWALKQVGFGEVDGNNRGVFVEALGAPAGSPWCAFLVSWILTKAYSEAQIPRPFAISGSAKHLADSVAHAGHGYTDLTKAKPGDLFCLNRGGVGAPTGHIGIVLANNRNGTLVCLDGNHSIPPAAVRVFQFGAAELGELYKFASIRENSP